MKRVWGDIYIWAKMRRMCDMTQKSARLSCKLCKLLRNGDSSSSVLLTCWTGRVLQKPLSHNFRYLLNRNAIYKMAVIAHSERKGKDDWAANMQFLYLREQLSWRTSWGPSLGPPAAAWWHQAPCRGCWPSPASSHSAPGYLAHAWKRKCTKISSGVGKMFAFLSLPLRFPLGAHLSSSRLRRISSSSSLWMQVPSLLIFSKCFFTSSLHSDCNTTRRQSGEVNSTVHCRCHWAVVVVLCFPPSSTNLRLEVRLLRSSQDISGGDVEVKQDLSKWGPIPGFALPWNQQQAGWMVDSNSENQKHRLNVTVV